ncbi:hypothetical protein [Klebsiella pneumoniae]|uniref:hypothetical protein n=1 Tax=Klebsiella pneumoniae TaxID=573 RepID=UPI001D1224EE|nr:hypothetical protein [Klebsiella pneumoniae]MCD5623671.1 hypothetical protein [Klebsiella pneumoniae]MCD5697646.1 hypothetical protein [Klebsiella pneumoniae]MCD5818933.1 hypothetical protein [Klebsiella pneumoniae]MCD9406909.1 hypothetical protein [Klebsiella pneumoniae]MCS4402564.1 hypothetical protein [Klebsiella pneumoniae]
MNIKEIGNVFHCDCGFSWHRGKNGNHNCADGLREKVRQLAAENVALKSAITDHSHSVHFCEVCGKDDPCSTDDVCYALKNIPATDAYLAGIKAEGRAEGINFAASRLAAAFNHGFVDKPMAEVGDVVRMILTAKEDLANDPVLAADGLSGEYAEKSLAEWEAELREEADK